MSEENKSRIQIPLPAVTALLTCLFGFVYCLNCRSIFERLHWYDISMNSNLSYEGFQSLLTFYGITMFVYYVMYLVMSCRILLKVDDHMTAVLIVMVSMKVITIGMMFIVGFSMLFRLGFETFLELVALVCLMILRKGIRTHERFYDSRFSVGIIAILAEAIPLIRNLQLLFLDDVNVFVRIAMILLPITTAATLFFFTLRALEPFRSLPLSEETA